MDLILATHYLPIGTTSLSAVFASVLFRAATTRRSGPHLWWWAIGVCAYGAGTLAESLIALQGNSVLLTKIWYVTGALLGGFPLAQGAVYLHVNRKLANALGWFFSILIVCLSVLVMMSPAIQAAVEATRPSGKVLGWQWIRWVVPFVNLYSFVFLVGGAIASAVKYSKSQEAGARVIGNVLIAAGGLLPGVGGGMAAAGRVEALYVFELIGLILIWAGYQKIAAESRAAAGFGSTRAGSPV